MIGSGKQWPLAAATGMLALLAGFVVLHIVHASAGHRALAAYGPSIAGLIAITMSLLPYRGVRWDTRLTIWAGVVLLVLGGEWLESELTAGHELSFALRDHGRIVAGTLGTAAGLGVFVQATRALDLLLDAFSTRRGH